MKAFIYDMDGVICDSEPVHNKAIKHVLHKAGATDVSDDDLRECQGSSEQNLWTLLASKFQLRFSPEALAKAKKYLFDRMMHEQGVTPIDGVLPLIEYTHELRAAGLKTAIASSSARYFIEFVTESLGIADKFDMLQSGAELPQSKPDPAIYIKTAQALETDPADCVVIEDTENGVRAAKAAGMYCIGFRSPHSPGQDLSLADCVVSDMAEVISLLDGWAEKDLCQQ